MDSFFICKKDECTGCGLCKELCPKKAITMIEEKDGFKYPSIDKNKCVKCNLCKRNCHNNKNLKKNLSNFYMAINKSDDILKNSSSGGAFSAICDLVFEKNGIVIGAELDKDTKEVNHVIIEKKEDLNRIRMSKYYQSNTEGIFTKVVKFLKEDRNVLFSGTACQIAALYSIVPDKLTDKLITVDVLCHGVSSKKVVDSYIKSEEKRLNKKIVSYSFRVKNEDGWNNGAGSRMKLVFEDGSSHINDFNNPDSFFLSFNRNVILRESCYNCKYCGTERISDFTIADFWGVTSKRATIDEKNKGISILVCNTDKAKGLMKQLNELLKITEISKDEVIPYNKAFVKPNDRPKTRKMFFKLLNKKMDYNKIVKIVFIKFFIKQKIKRIIGYKK